MLEIPSKELVSSVAPQHSDVAASAYIRRVSHHAETPRKSYAQRTTLKRTSILPRTFPEPIPT